MLVPDNMLMNIFVWVCFGLGIAFTFWTLLKSKWESKWEKENGLE